MKDVIRKITLKVKCSSELDEYIWRLLDRMNIAYCYLLMNPGVLEGLTRKMQQRVLKDRNV